MAEAVLFNIAEGILWELTSSAVQALIQEIGLLCSLEDDVRGLEDTISTVKAVLLDAEEKQTNNNQLKLWLGKLKDAVCDADDLLDDLRAEALRRQLMAGNKLKKKVRLFFSNSNQLVYGFRMAQKVKLLKKRLDRISEIRGKFQLEERLEKRQIVNKREDTHAIMREVIIGREKDKEIIIELLLNFNVGEKLSVVPVIGIGGLGKTAIAQCVFNDENIQKGFDLKIWICISDNFDTKIVIRKILEDVIHSNVVDLEINTLVSNLKKEIDGKKFLLVLDDVWNEDREKWLGFEDILKCGAVGCKILLTARGEKVANATTATSVYHLQGLDDDESWTLFKNAAFGQSCEPRNEKFTSIGKEIAKKCSGVPLVIRTIGSLLYKQDTETKWLYFKNNELSKINQDGENKILATLYLSYMYLPSHLKHCFAYCSLFPKHHWIDVQMLVHMWIAHGFVKLGNKSDTLEEIGNEYFLDLYQRGFFQELDESLGTRTCKMHDLMHELAIDVAGVECISLDLEDKSLDRRTRHLSFNNVLSTSWNMSSLLGRAKQLRTFMFPIQARESSIVGVGTPITTYVDLFLKFRCLRVLDLHALFIEVLPESIGKLKHLRYLNISKNKFKGLPNSLSKLISLQTLNLCQCKELQKLPKDLRKLVNLRHLDINECINLEYMPCGIGCLTSLQTLPLFMVDRSNSKYSGTLSEMKNLNCLKGKLEIENLGHDLLTKSDFDAANLKEKSGLQTLKLSWRITREFTTEDESILESLSCLSNLEGLEIFYYMSPQFPRWMMDSMASLLPNIRSISLYYCKTCKQLPRFEKLPHLKSLSFSRLEKLEYIDDRVYVESLIDAFFPSLEQLSISYLTNFKGWWRETGTVNHLPSFPYLSSLEIVECPKLKSMPSRPSLTKLYLTLVSSKMLQQHLMMENMPVLPSSSSSCPFSTLEQLHIAYVIDLKHLPENWLKNLKSLTRLAIRSCNSILSIPDLSGLTSLKEVSITECEALKTLPQGIEHLPLLENLDIDISCFEDVDLDRDANGMPFKSLRRLELSNARASLPDWLGSLTTLLHIKICYSSELEILPAWVCNFKSLQRLVIEGCPLTQRMKKNKGDEDWGKISHIPYIEIAYEVIQHRRH